MSERDIAPLLSEESSARLQSWLDDKLGGQEEIQVAPIGAGQGTANLMMLIRRGNVELVLRRPPDLKVTATAGNIEREATLLRALGQTQVPHARFVTACGSTDVIGAPFLLMERVRDFVPSDPLPPILGEDPVLKKQIGLELIDALVALGTADWQAIGLDGFGKPVGFLARQVERWLWQLESYQCREIASQQAVVSWLQEKLPSAGPVGIMHGDYSTFNVMFDDDQPGRLRAVIDWDTATIGEVLMDVGHLLSRWDEPGEQPTTLGSSDIADRSGLVSRAAMIDRYATGTGFDVGQIRYYEVLSLFKLACIMEGQYANHVRNTPDQPMGPFTNIGPALMDDALAIAEGRTHLND